MRRNCDKEGLIFRWLFEEYFKVLVRYACHITRDWHMAEDIVQDVFLAVWDKRSEIGLQPNLRAYLFRAVHNHALNNISSTLAQSYRLTIIVDDMCCNERLTYNLPDTLLLHQISSEVDAVVGSLAPQCQQIYIMSRKRLMKNKEIAHATGLSEKTVEKNITKALGMIRIRLERLDLLTAV